MARQSFFSTYLRPILFLHLCQFFISMALQVVALGVSDRDTKAKLHFAGAIFTYWGYTGGNFAYQMIYFKVFNGTCLMKPIHRTLHWASTISYFFAATAATISAGYHDLSQHYYIVNFGNPVDLAIFLVLCLSAGAGNVLLSYSLIDMYRMLSKQPVVVQANSAESPGAVSAPNLEDPEKGGHPPNTAGGGGKPDKIIKTDQLSLTVRLWVITSNVNALFGSAAVIVCHPAVLLAAGISASCYYILIRRSLLAIAYEGSQVSGAKGNSSAQRSSTKQPTTNSTKALGSSEGRSSQALRP